MSGQTEDEAPQHPALTEALADFHEHDEQALRATWAERATELPHAYPDVDLDQEVAHHVRVACRQFASLQYRVPAPYREAHLAGLRADQHEQELRRWLDDESASTLFLAGPPGRGKTHAAWAALALVEARAALQSSRPATRGWTIPGLLEALRAPDGENTWGLAKAVPVALLDDLGNLRVTDWAVERMWMLADARAGLRQIITSNASWPDLVNTWGEPTMERFRDRSVVVKFAGGNLRRPAW